MANTEIKKNSRVRVKVYRNGYFKREFRGEFIAWTNSGLAKVLEDGHDRAKTHSSDNVKLIRQ